MKVASFTTLPIRDRRAYGCTKGAAPPLAEPTISHPTMPPSTGTMVMAQLERFVSVMCLPVLNLSDGPLLPSQATVSSPRPT
eukprot:5226385-Pyramimonas_sp.AAC.2